MLALACQLVVGASARGLLVPLVKTCHDLSRVDLPMPCCCYTLAHCPCIDVKRPGCRARLLKDVLAALYTVDQPLGHWIGPRVLDRWTPNKYTQSVNPTR